MRIKKTLNALFILLCLIFLLLFTPKISKSDIFTTLPDYDYNFNEDYLNESVYEWKIQNVNLQNFTDEFTIANDDILEVKLNRDMNNYTFYPLSVPITYYILGWYFIISINGEDFENQWYYLIYGCSKYYSISSYYVFFDFWNPTSLNLLEPIFFYPLEFINNSISTPYFDLLYDTLSRKAIELENMNSNIDITISKGETYFEIEFSITENKADYVISSDQLLSINMEEGILGFYSVDYEYTDKLNDSDSHSFSYEVYSENYGSSAYRTEMTFIDFILITLFGGLCITWILKKRKIIL